MARWNPTEKGWPRTGTNWRQDCGYPTWGRRTRAYTRAWPKAIRASLGARRSWACSTRNRPKTRIYNLQYSSRVLFLNARPGKENGSSWPWNFKVFTNNIISLTSNNEAGYLIYTSPYFVFPKRGFWWRFKIYRHKNISRKFIVKTFQR